MNGLKTTGPVGWKTSGHFGKTGHIVHDGKDRDLCREIVRYTGINHFQYKMVDLYKFLFGCRNISIVEFNMYRVDQEFPSQKKLPLPIIQAGNFWVLFFQIDLGEFCTYADA